MRASLFHLHGPDPNASDFCPGFDPAPHRTIRKGRFSECPLRSFPGISGECIWRSLFRHCGLIAKIVEGIVVPALCNHDRLIAEDLPGEINLLWKYGRRHLPGGIGVQIAIIKSADRSAKCLSVCDQGKRWGNHMRADCAGKRLSRRENTRLIISRSTLTQFARPLTSSSFGPSNNSMVLPANCSTCSSRAGVRGPRLLRGSSTASKRIPSRPRSTQRAVK